MIKFGGSGTGNSFAEEGLISTVQVPAWLKARDLDLYEYSFGRGVRMSEKTANVIGEEFKKYDIEISVHAPYYINMATEEELKAKNNHRYIVESITALRIMGGNRCVFHPGAPLKRDRDESMKTLFSRMDNLLKDLYDRQMNDTKLAVETMGKLSQLGNVEEIIAICNMDKMLLPCVDFGHLNARGIGAIKGYDDYAKLLEQFINGLGYDKINDMHVHFSKIEYTQKGELRHLTFEDDKFGPNFEPLAQALIDFDLHPYIVCESSGTQTEDAMYMKRYYNSLVKN